jgi:hypothetical protein
MAVSSAVSKAFKRATRRQANNPFMPCIFYIFRVIQRVSGFEILEISGRSLNRRKPLA